MIGRKRVVAPKAKSRSVSRPRKKKATNLVKAIASKQLQARPIGNALSTTLHYVESHVLNPGALGAAAVQTYRLSSIFDPDLTGVGHQPLGRDELAGLFERYQVFKVDFHVEFGSRDSAVQLCGYMINDSPSTSTSGSRIIENGGSEWFLMQPQGGTDHTKFTGSVWLNEAHGVSYKQYMANDDYGAAMGSNPADEIYMHFWADGLGGDTAGVTCVVHLVYHTKLMGSILSTQS